MGGNGSSSPRLRPGTAETLFIWTHYYTTVREDVCECENATGELCWILYAPGQLLHQKHILKSKIPACKRGGNFNNRELAIQGGFPCLSPLSKRCP